MGLSREVLNKLLVIEQEEPREPFAHTVHLSPTSFHSTRGEAISTHEDKDGDVLEFEFESDGTSPAISDGVTPSAAPVRYPRTQKVVIDAVLDEDESKMRDHRNGFLESCKAGPSSLPIGSPPYARHRKFRLRLLSELSTLPSVPVMPIGVTEMIRIRSERGEQDNKPIRRELRYSSDTPRRERKVRTVLADGHGGVKAEYLLVGMIIHDCV